MPEVNVPIGAPVIKNIDKSIVSDSANRLMNGFLDEEGNINAMPGTLTGADLSAIVAGADIDSAYWWDEIERIIAIIRGHIVVIDQNLSGVSLSDSGALTVMAVGTKATFATDGTNLFIANGGPIVKTDGSHAASTAPISDADAPTAVTHIIIPDGYLMALEAGTGKIHWSVLNNPDSWAVLDFATAEGNPDDGVALYLFRKEIYIFGKLSLEIWEDDGVSPFSPVSGGYIDVGCIAPYSVAKTDNGVIWLSHYKRFVIYSGGGIDPLSTPFDTEIDKFGVVSDCIAERVDIAGRTFFIFTFPSENRTLCYNMTNKNWAELGYWNGNSGLFDKWIGLCHAFSPLWNRHFVGSSRANSKLYLLSSDYTTEDGSPKAMEQITGKLDFGTNHEKISKKFSMSVKRGTVTDTSEPVMMLSYNDDNEGWSNEIQLSLGKMGDNINVLPVEGLGRYRNRQYKFRVTDSVNISYGSAREDITVTSR